MCSHPVKPILASSLYQRTDKETSLRHTPSISPTGIYTDPSDSDPMAQGSSTLSPYSVSVSMSLFAHKNTNVCINSFCLFRISLSAPLLTTKLLLNPECFCHLRICSTENIYLKVCAKKLSAPLFSCYKFIPLLSGSLPLDFQDKLVLCHPAPMMLLPLPPSTDRKVCHHAWLQASICSDNFIYILVIILSLFNMILQFVSK